MLAPDVEGLRVKRWLTVEPAGKGEFQFKRDRDFYRDFQGLYRVGFSG
jgi:hypothetical protein